MTNYDELLPKWKKAYLWRSIGAVLGWDQQCTMPPKSASFRGEQIGYLAQMVHAELTSREYQTLLQKAWGEVAPLATSDLKRCNVLKAKRVFEREKSLPLTLVDDLTRAMVEGQSAWEEAKKRQDFHHFAPLLKRQIELSRIKADYLGYEKKPYDALIPDFEWGVDTEILDSIFIPLQKELTRLVDFAKRKSGDVNKSIATGFAVQKQAELARNLAEELGFNFDDGVLQRSAHPFSTTLGPHDFRITTRYDENDLLSAFAAVAHEVGHSLYERGIPGPWRSEPIGEASSAGIHESQSLFWEKRITYSQAFLAQWLSRFQASFPTQLSHLDQESFYRFANRVEPSLIRVDADEVTYSLHIIIRYELEKALINEGLEVGELPRLWREKYRDYLGIEPANDAEGCLQDVHWSCGAFGYFPSYALGHIFSAQFTASMEKELGAIDGLINSGKLTTILGWLRRNIHQKGGIMDSLDLVEAVTGAPLSIQPFITYLNRKVLDIYT